MPIRTVLLLLCAQNPRIENDLESLSTFIKSMRESVVGMRSSMANLHSSTSEFHNTMGLKVNKPQQKINYPSQESKKNAWAKDDFTSPSAEKSDSDDQDFTEWEERKK